MKAARVLHGSGEFERVDVRTVLEEGRRTVVIDVNEKPWGPNYLRIGARAVSDFDTQGALLHHPAAHAHLGEFVGRGMAQRARAGRRAPRPHLLLPAAGSGQPLVRRRLAAGGEERRRHLRGHAPHRPRDARGHRLVRAGRPPPRRRGRAEVRRRARALQGHAGHQQPRRRQHQRQRDGPARGHPLRHARQRRLSAPRLRVRCRRLPLQLQEPRRSDRGVAGERPPADHIRAPHASEPRASPNARATTACPSPWAASST